MKNKALLAFIFAILLTLTSCTESSDIIGEWVICNKNDFSQPKTSMEFRDDGKLIHIQGDAKTVGEWEQESEDKIALIYEEKNDLVQETALIIEKKPGQMEVSLSRVDKKKVVTFYRRQRFIDLHADVQKACEDFLREKGLLEEEIEAIDFTDIRTIGDKAILEHAPRDGKLFVVNLRETSVTLPDGKRYKSWKGKSITGGKFGPSLDDAESVAKFMCDKTKEMMRYAEDLEGNASKIEALDREMEAFEEKLEQFHGRNEKDFQRKVQSKFKRNCDIDLGL